jgi:hypothetical protein
MGMTYSGGSGDYEDGPSVFHQETLKAKLSHRCTECRGIIEAGQHYERSSGIWDGRWSTYRKCKFCMDFESAFDAQFKGFMHSSAFGEMLSDSQHEMYRLYSVDHPGRWFGVARKYVAIKRNYYSQLKRGIVDKAGRGNVPTRGPFGYSIKKEREIFKQMKEQNEARTEEALG